jgi:hypothetical protein
MRHTFPRDFYVPKNATPFDCGDTDAAVFLYDVPGLKLNGQRALGAIAFHGKANKPDWNYTFKTEERRAACIAEFLARRRSHAEYRAKKKTERSAPHPLVIGAILHTSWGYDQTNVEYFEVTRIVGPHTVELRELAQERSETGFMSGKCKPIPGKYLSPRYDGDETGVAIVRRARADGSVRIDSVRNAWLGSGERYWSSYA